MSANGSTALTATFCYNDYRDPDVDIAPCHPAPAADGDWSAIAELVDDNEDDMGSVIINHGVDEVRIEDSLTATITNLCLDAIDDLAGKRHVVVPYFMTYGYLRLDPEASDQLVSGDFVPTVRFPRAELIPALVDVGARYLAFLRRCRADHDGDGELIADVAKRLDHAKSALRRWDGT